MYVGGIKAYSKKNVCNGIYWLKCKDLGLARPKIGVRIPLNTVRRGLSFIWGTIGVMRISSWEGQQNSNILEVLI